MERSVRRVEKNKRPGGLPAPNQGEESKSDSSLNENSGVVKGSYCHDPKVKALTDYILGLEPLDIYYTFTHRDVPGQGMRALSSGRQFHPSVEGGQWSPKRIRMHYDRLPHMPSDNLVIRDHKRFIHHLNHQIFGRNYWKRPDEGVRVCYAAERQRRGALHYHGVIAGVPKEVNTMDFRLALNDYCWERYGQTRIHQFDYSKGGLFYMAKAAYAFKMADIDFMGPWGRASKNLSF